MNSPTPPKIVALIPARGGSKGIPRKNLKRVCGKRLLSYSVEHALGTPEIDEVIVSTDCPEIAEVAATLGATVVDRPAELSTDVCPSEPALLHALDWLVERDGVEPELVVFLQATSPLRPPGASSRAIETLRKKYADSLFSASTVHGFIWRVDGDSAVAVSYDHRHRTRRQESVEHLEENGSIYVFRPWVLREGGNRLGGRIAVYRMDGLFAAQIDEPGDIERIEDLMRLATGRQRDANPMEDK